MDGVLADFSTAYYAVEDRLFGAGQHLRRAADPETQRTDEPPKEATPAEARSPQASLKNQRRRSDAVWHAIRNTPDFWLSLDPTNSGAVRRIHELMLQYRWEVFFITQRPATLGDTVQRQTQRWLVSQGFDMPSVLVVPASRGAAAGALSLDYHVDDSPQNCIDVKSDSAAKPILILDDEDEDTAVTAGRLGIATAASIAQALDILAEASVKQPGLLDRLAHLAGLR